ncbi:MAG: protein kinase [Deltaproteobacteria bacterium]
MTRPDAPHIPNYQLVEPLGAGGMASVWLARREHSTQCCVVKVLHETLWEHDDHARRFQREAQVCALLDHPNIARLHDTGRLDTSWYLAMELVAGCDLERILAERDLPFELTLAVAYQVLDALHYAHTLKDADGSPLALVHRDLSPKNIMASFDGRTKVIDFGLARADVGSFKTRPGTISGTAGYMSPEQASGDTIDARSDLYTVAAVLYEMWTGKRLVAKTTFHESLLAVITHKPQPPSTIDAALPQALDAVLMKALSKLPSERFETALAFKEALMAALAGHEPLGEAEVGAWMRTEFSAEHDAMTAMQAAVFEDTEPPVEPTRTGKPQATVAPRRAPEQAVVPKRRHLAVGALASVLVVGVAGVWWSSRPGEIEQRAAEPTKVVAPSVEQRVALEPLRSDTDAPAERPPAPRAAPKRARKQRPAVREEPPKEVKQPTAPKTRLRALYKRAVAMRDAASGSRRAEIEAVIALLVRESAAREVSGATVDALAARLEGIGK